MGLRSISTGALIVRAGETAAGHGYHSRSLRQRGRVSYTTTVLSGHLPHIHPTHSGSAIASTIALVEILLVIRKYNPLA
jgi:hypothetical protein